MGDPIPLPLSKRCQVNNRDVLASHVSSASPPRMQPSPARRGVCRPTIYSPHPPPVTVYTGKTGKVQSSHLRHV